MSYRENAMQERYTEVTVLGKPMLFTDLRIDRATVPKGLYIYEVRHDDDKWGDPAQMTLCGRCLDSYWRTNAFYIRRADPSQFSKEICTFCGMRMGFDYFLTPKNVEAQEHDQS